MHYCLSAQVGNEYIKKADEIRLRYKELDKMLDLYEINPELSIILTIKDQEKSEVNWEEIERYNKMWKDKVIVETDSFAVMDACKLFNIKYFYGIPVNNFYDFQALIDCGCCDIKIDAPLTHMLDRLINFDVTIRMSPNIAYYAFIPRENGIIGGWVRPEDVELYEDYVDVFEFEDCDVKKEKALFRVYAEQKNWPGDLNSLITNLSYNATNRMILPDFGKVRMFCGQKCTMGINCTVCKRIMNLANPNKIEEFKKSIEENNENVDN